MTAISLYNAQSHYLLYALPKVFAKVRNDKKGKK